MTIRTEQLAGLIFEALTEVNEQLEPERRITPTADTVLLGKEAALDSLQLVNLIVAVEGRIQDELGLTVTLADERAMSRKSSPFRTVASFAEYAAMLVAEAGDA